MSIKVWVNLLAALKPPIVTVQSLPEKNGFNISWISDSPSNEVNLKRPGKSTLLFYSVKAHPCCAFLNFWLKSYC